MDQFVPEAAIDYVAIFSRGGANCGDEDFAFFKCPACGRLYLLEYEVDTVYLDANDLSLRVPVFDCSFNCLNCGKPVPNDTPWAGKKADHRFLVTWGELLSSDWSWAARRDPPANPATQL